MSSLGPLLGGQDSGAGACMDGPQRPRAAPAGPLSPGLPHPLHAAARSLHTSVPQPQPWLQLSSSTWVYNLTSVSELSKKMGNNQYLRKKERAGWLGRKDSPCTHTSFEQESPAFRFHMPWPWTNLAEPPLPVNPQGTTQSLFQPED